MISQGCPDLALLAVAAKDDTNHSPLSFVHIVKDDDIKSCQAATGDEGDKGSKEDYDNDSDEEFEREDDDDDDGIDNQKADSAGETSDEEYEFE